MEASLDDSRVGRLAVRRPVRRASDASLVRAAQGGSERAIEKLFARHWPDAYRTALLIAHDRAAAEDIAQEAFLSALRALPRFDRSRPLRPWLHRIVVNRAIDWARARRLRQEVAVEALPEVAAPPADVTGLGARARALGVVRAAYVELEPPRPRRGWAPLLAVVASGLAAVVIALSFTEPGDAVARWVREVLGVGRGDARPALVRVPGGGRLLVMAEGGRGAWVVSADGSRRRLGDYAGASWSPHGRFVVAWRGGELFAVEPGGGVRWSLARRGRIAAARWAPVDGFRIAYLSGRTLRVVNGDGTGDRRYAAASAVAPSWRPDGRHVLAFVDRRDRVRVAAVDSRRELWRSRAVGGAIELAWSPDGRRLLAVTAGGWWVFGADGQVLARGPGRRGFALDGVAWSPRGDRIAIVRRVSDASDVLLVDPAGRARDRVLFSGPGRFGRVAFSPDGRRLLVPWPEADQWLFLSVARGGDVGAVAKIARQFARGPRPGPFPDAVECCCAGA